MERSSPHETRKWLIRIVRAARVRVADSAEDHWRLLEQGQPDRAARAAADVRRWSAIGEWFRLKLVASGPVPLDLLESFYFTLTLCCR